LGTIDAPSPPAPCDFARFYRGAMDGTKLSIVLRRSGGSLRGASAYDGGFGELELTGEVGADNRFQLHERKEGKEIATLEGTCAADSGLLTGKWKQGAVERAFSLRPREASGVGLVERRRKLGKAGDTMPVCDLEIVSPAVFGLGDDPRTARINGFLRMGFGASEAEIEARVKQCPPGGDS
jgi:hypothetical protein